MCVGEYSTQGEGMLKLVYPTDTTLLVFYIFKNLAAHIKILKIFWKMNKAPKQFKFIELFAHMVMLNRFW